MKSYIIYLCLVSFGFFLGWLSASWIIDRHLKTTEAYRNFEQLKKDWVDIIMNSQESSITISHAPGCPINTPGIEYVRIDERPTCNCDFGMRLKDYLRL